MTVILAKGGHTGWGWLAGHPAVFRLGLMAAAKAPGAGASNIIVCSAFPARSQCRPAASATEVRLDAAGDR